MTRKDLWFETFSDHFAREKEKISAKDFRFFHLEKFSRIAGITNQLSDNCRECSEFRNRIMEDAVKLGSMINGSGKDLRNYENLLDDTGGHLRKSHGYYPSFYFNYLYVFYGFALGLAICILLYLIVSGWHSKQVLLILPLTGILLGQIAGRRRDNQVRHLGRKL